jgi:hypothetical protein
MRSYEALVAVCRLTPILCSFVYANASVMCAPLVGLRQHSTPVQIGQTAAPASYEFNLEDGSHWPASTLGP